MKICKVCGEPNASESRFCINCGSESFEVSDVKQKICPECGSVCEPQFTHCVNCGAALGDANVSGVASIQSGGTVSRDSENPDETAVCPYCGAEISLHTVFCAGCGHDVTAMNRHRVVRRKICRFLRQAQQAGGQILQVLLFRPERRRNGRISVGLCRRSG